jgi:hypothetical protein
LKVGKVYYLVGAAWWRAWRSYATAADDETVPPPGPVDNAPLLALAAPAALEDLAGRSAARSASNWDPLSIDDDDGGGGGAVAPGGGSTAAAAAAAAAAGLSGGRGGQSHAQGAAWELRRGVREGRDFQAVSALAWGRLVAWHGGGPAVARRAFSDLPGGAAAQYDLYGVPLVARRSGDSQVARCGGREGGGGTAGGRWFEFGNYTSAEVSLKLR